MMPLADMLLLSLCALFRGSHAALSTPNPSPQAQRVYDLLTSLEYDATHNGPKRTIMGQHCEAHKDVIDSNGNLNLQNVGRYWQKVNDITGRYPGFLEFDLGPGNGNPTYQEAYVDAEIAFAKDRFLKGEAIIGFSFHTSYPTSSRKEWWNVLKPSWMTQSWANRVVDWQSNTPEYVALLGDLAFAADKLSILADANVPVLFRPFHEMNNGAFWWSNWDAAFYRQLWVITHDYMVKTRKLRNLIFVWTAQSWGPNAGGLIEPFNYYPGSDRVDVIGLDIYAGSPPFTRQWYQDLAQYSKPRIVSECDKVPVKSTVNELQAMPVAIWLMWGELLVTDWWNYDNNYQGIKETYAFDNGRDRTLTGGPQGNFNWGALMKSVSRSPFVQPRTPSPLIRSGLPSPAKSASPFSAPRSSSPITSRSRSPPLKPRSPSPVSKCSKIADFGSPCGAGTCCQGGQCCSQWGWCGETNLHCGQGCQSTWGYCWPAALASTATLGTISGTIGTHYYDIRGRSCPGSTGFAANENYPSCASTAAGPNRLTLRQLNSNNVVAIDSALLSVNRAKYCGKKAIVTYNGVQVLAPDGGDFFIWDGCTSCSNGAVGFSLSGLSQINNQSSCGSGGVHGVSVRIADVAVLPFVP